MYASAYECKQSAKLTCSVRVMWRHVSTIFARPGNRSALISYHILYVYVQAPPARAGLPRLILLRRQPRPNNLSVLCSHPSCLLSCGPLCQNSRKRKCPTGNNFDNKQVQGKTLLSPCGVAPDILWQAKSGMARFVRAEVWLFAVKLELLLGALPVVPINQRVAW